jgi:hypothetical protein
LRNAAKALAEGQRAARSATQDGSRDAAKALAEGQRAAKATARPAMCAKSDTMPTAIARIFVNTVIKQRANATATRI